MRTSEAAFIGARLRDIPIEHLSPVLNLGSSNAEFRRRTHPHVDREIFFPLEARGARVIHADLKQDDGIDVVGDVYDPVFQEQCRQLRPRTVLCCNILEHVQDARGFADIVSRLVPADGYLVVSVPHSYPFHADPIDTLFRPAPDEVVTMFGPTFAPVVAHTLVDTTWLQDLTRALGPRRLPGFFARDLAKAAREALSRQRLRRLHRYLWLVRRYQISIVILRRRYA
jgi:hypothetical protein